MLRMTPRQRPATTVLLQKRTSSVHADNQGVRMTWHDISWRHVMICHEDLSSVFTGLPRKNSVVSGHVWFRYRVFASRHELTDSPLLRIDGISFCEFSPRSDCHVMSWKIQPAVMSCEHADSSQKVSCTSLEITLFWNTCWTNLICSFTRIRNDRSSYYW